MRPASERSASLSGVCALTGASLLAASELADRLEPELGLNALDLYFALAIAIVVVFSLAVAGDIVLSAIERRAGHRPGPRPANWLMTAAGTGAVIDIAIHHLRHAPALDASLGLAGGLLLLAAAALHRHTSAPTPGSPARAALAASPPHARQARTRRIRISVRTRRPYLPTRADRSAAIRSAARRHLLGRAGPRRDQRA